MAARAELAGQRHSELLLPMVDAVLAQAGLGLADLDGVGFGAGPGSFTGLRIACGVAQGLALGAGLKVVPVGTLLALAHDAGAGRVLACLDARMGEVYLAAYEREAGGWTQRVAPSVCKAQAAPPLEGGGWTAVGSAFRAYGDALEARYRGQLARVDPDAWPQAGPVAGLAAEVLAAGGGLPAEQAAPLYVRDRVALKMHEQR
jgi:tRNA threonylcarbamoyladenosine biosynthesis protein TsaB